MAQVGLTKILSQNDSFISSKFIFLSLLVACVWILFEYLRRARPGLSMRQLAPEITGLLLVVASISYLLVSRKEHGLGEDEASLNVKAEWPLLMTADSLLGMQALLRPVLLLSATFRRKEFEASPLDGEPAALLLCAAAARALLLAYSPRDLYHVEGPLGGDLNVTAEFFGLALILPLGWRVVHKGFRDIAMFMSTVVFAAVLAYFNHFELADPTNCYLDQLFSLVMLLEVFAGLAFLSQTTAAAAIHCEGGTFAGFAHVLLPVQQALPAYFLLCAFAPPFTVEPAIVGRGLPFQLLQVGSIAQVCSYLAAAGIYMNSRIAANAMLEKYATLVPEEHAPAADECAICLGSSEGAHQWRQLACGHCFHEKCMLGWMQHSKLSCKAQQCPMCRQSLVAKKVPTWGGMAKHPELPWEPEFESEC